MKKSLMLFLAWLVIVYVVAYAVLGSCRELYLSYGSVVFVSFLIWLGSIIWKFTPMLAMIVFFVISAWVGCITFVSCLIAGVNGDYTVVYFIASSVSVLLLLSCLALEKLMRKKYIPR